jgi:hypothetical protein
MSEEALTVLRHRILRSSKHMLGSREGDAGDPDTVESEGRE